MENTSMALIFINGVSMSVGVLYFLYSTGAFGVQPKKYKTEAELEEEARERRREKLLKQQAYAETFGSKDVKRL